MSIAGSFLGSRLRRRLALLFLLPILLSVSGCTTRFIYNRLDWVTVWYMDRYFSLTHEQETKLRGLVARNLDWHRRTQLPRYAEFCRQLDRQTGGRLTPETMRARYDEMLTFWDDFMLHVIPDAQVFLMSLTPAELETAFEKMEEANQELYDEYSGDTKQRRQKRRDKAAIRGIQMFTGKLNKQQQELVKASTASMLDASEDWIENRRVWQQRFRQLLESQRPPDEFRAELTELFVYPRNAHDEDYRRRVEHNLDIFFHMVVTLDRQLTNAQRKRMSRRLNNYARDFELLAAAQ